MCIRLRHDLIWIEVSLHFSRKVTVIIKVISRQIITIIIIIFVVVLKDSNALTPVFSLSFDHGFEGDWSRKKGIIKNVGKLEFVPGKIGKGIKVNSQGYLLISDANLFVGSKEGTFEFWVKPVDWKPDDGKFHVFVEVEGKGRLVLYKYYNNKKLILYSDPKAVEGSSYNISQKIDWKLNQWHHVVGSWTQNSLMLYIDGLKVSSRPAEAVTPTYLNGNILIGDRDWGMLRESSTVIDEVKIYNTELSPEVVKLHSQGLLNEEKYLNFDDIWINSTTDKKKDTVQFVLVNSQHIVKDTDVIRVYLNGKQWTKLDTKRKNNDKDLVLKMPFSEIEEGKNKLRVVLFRKDKQQKEITYFYEMPKLNWGERVDTNSVMPSFQSDMKPNDTVFVWGREISFKNAAFPTSIVSQEKELLSGAIKLVLSNNSKQYKFQLDGLKSYVGTDRSNKVELFRQRLSAELLNKKIVINVNVGIEKDGLIWITLDSIDNINLSAEEELVFEIPLNNDLYKYVHHWAVDSKNNNLNIPQGNFKLTKPFIPYFWLGNDDIGLFWYSETSRNWPSGRDERVIELTRDGDGLLFKVWIKNKNKSFQGKISAHFGLFPTPVKPRKNLHRSMRIRPSFKANIDIIWPSPTDTSLKHYGYPEAMNPQKFKKRIDILKKRGIQSMPYLCPTFLSTGAPEWSFYKDKWFLGRYDSSSHGVRQYGGSFALVNPREKSWRRFFTSKASSFLKKFGISYIYYDNTKPYGGFNLSSGVGYVQNGKGYKEFPINSYRALFRELNNGYKSKGLKVISLAHVSGDLNIPVLSFVDAYLDGEQFRGLVKDDYMDVVSLSSFRTEFTGQQWGLSSLFIPQFSKENAAKIAPTRGLMGLLMLHDVGIWPIWCNIEVVNKALKMLLKFDYEDAKFTPYYSPDVIAFSKIDDVYISTYSKNNSYLLVVSNLSKTNRSGEICIKKNIKVNKLEFWTKKDKLILNNDNCLDIRVGAQDYELMKLTDYNGTFN